ncbi:hypothetical protein C8J57DRAFT_1253308 [Mycena rebaudengoi]|nr:hypothetical protein C8J57DRAFT_1253308 [Mycena rebaudengoi]
MKIAGEHCHRLSFYVCKNTESRSGGNGVERMKPDDVESAERRNGSTLAIASGKDCVHESRQKRLWVCPIPDDAPLELGQESIAYQQLEAQIVEEDGLRIHQSKGCGCRHIMQTLRA